MHLLTVRPGMDVVLSQSFYKETVHKDILSQGEGDFSSANILRTRGVLQMRTSALLVILKLRIFRNF